MQFRRLAAIVFSVVYTPVAMYRLYFYFRHFAKGAILNQALRSFNAKTVVAIINVPATSETYFRTQQITP